MVRVGNKDASTTASSASSSVASGPTTLVRGGDGQLPAFKAPADLGANCQYKAGEPASKKVDAPKTGKVPTDPATISVSMSTDQGNIGPVLNNAEAPCTVNSFASLAQKGFFDGTVCHRLTTTPGLGVLQCGDLDRHRLGACIRATRSPTSTRPTSTRRVIRRWTSRCSGYPRGSLAMANAGADTNGSQFFLVYKDSQLPPNYTVFGTIDGTGLATLDKVAQAGAAGGAQDGKPSTEVKVKSVLLD